MGSGFGCGSLIWGFARWPVRMSALTFSRLAASSRPSARADGPFTCKVRVVRAGIEPATFYIMRPPTRTPPPRVVMRPPERVASDRAFRV